MSNLTDFLPQVVTFNTRTGVVALGSSDVTTALSYTPLAPNDIGTTVQGYDSTILNSGDIGTTVQGYDANILVSGDIGTTVQGYDSTILNSGDIGTTVAPAVPAPSAFTSRALASTDNSATLTVATAQVATVNTGLPSGFGCVFTGAGAITFAGTADPTANDFRIAGAVNPICALIQTAVDTYAIYGSKI